MERSGNFFLVCMKRDEHIVAGLDVIRRHAKTAVRQSLRQRRKRWLEAEKNEAGKLFLRPQLYRLKDRDDRIVGHIFSDNRSALNVSVMHAGRQSKMYDRERRYLFFVLNARIPADLPPQLFLEFSPFPCLHKCADEREMVFHKFIPLVFIAHGNIFNGHGRRGIFLKVTVSPGTIPCVAVKPTFTSSTYWAGSSGK